MRAELDEKVAILSFRSTILSLIGSASMAIIAFSFPLPRGGWGIIIHRSSRQHPLITL